MRRRGKKWWLIRGSSRQVILLAILPLKLLCVHLNFCVCPFLWILGHLGFKVFCASIFFVLFAVACSCVVSLLLTNVSNIFSPLRLCRVSVRFLVFLVVMRRIEVRNSLLLSLVISSVVQQEKNKAHDLSAMSHDVSETGMTNRVGTWQWHTTGGR